MSRYADVAVDIETARLLVFNAARLKEAGQPFIKEVRSVVLQRCFLRRRSPTASTTFRIIDVVPQCVLRQ